MVERRSEIHAVLAGLPRKAEGPDAITLREHTPTLLTEVSAWPGTEGAVAAALEQVCGLRPEAQASRAVQGERATILTLTPRRWWLISGDPGLSPDFGTDTGTSVALSHARVGLRLSGQAASALLSRGMAVDLLPRAFPVDAVAQSGFAEVPAVLHRAGDQDYDLYLPRTFARHVLEWLIEAWPALVDGS